MIQRVQSLFLLAAAISTLVLLFAPLATITTSSHQFIYSAFSVRINTPDNTALLSTVYVAMALIVSTVISIVSIFMYKNRKKQIQMVSVNMILVLIVIFLATYVYPEFVFSKHSDLMNGELKFSLWTFIIFVPAFSLFFAKKFIAKDEALVTSADRLR